MDEDLRSSALFVLEKLLRTSTDALHDLTYAARKQAVARWPLPADLPVVAFHSETHAPP